MSDVHSTRQQILEAAYRCLSEKGSGHVSTRDVARTAGVTLSLIHYYFTSKEELLVAAARYALEREIRDLQAEIAPLRNVDDRVRHAVRFVRERFAAVESWYKVYFDLLTQAAWSPRIAAEVRKMQDGLVELIVTGAPDDTTPIGARRAFARVFLAGINGLALQVLHGAPADEIERAYRLFEHMLLSALSTGTGCAGSGERTPVVRAHAMSSASSWEGSGLR